MLFNSLNFAIFFPIIFLFYWFIFQKNLKLQNIFLLAASYFFYSCWDWRFLFLLIFSTALDFYTGLRISGSKSKKTKKAWLAASIIINLGFLGFFKYYNFFIDSFSDVLQSVGLKANFTSLQVILPVGISFYTFHGLSYVFDIYNEKIKPTSNWVDYSLFVSFFPLLVAGPIERATHLLPQVERKREFSYLRATDGLRQIAWGLFKKVVIADNCAEYANMIFDNAGSYSGSTLVIGALFFAFQIYGDFSGYSDIALGTARLLGFDLLKNFNFPYFSRDIAEFWRRWHISLSSWFRDYLYIPLGGSKVGTAMKVRNTFIIFLVSGFWHGANWTFICWGALNALYIMPSIILSTNRNNIDIVARGRLLPTLKESGQIILTFSLTVFAWIFFRAESLPKAFEYISGIFTSSLFEMPQVFPVKVLFLVMVFLLVEWLGRQQNYAIEKIGINWPVPLRWAWYYVLIISIYFWGNFSESIEFIYFQF